jgi:uncharacterized protein with von Willebrand factor type A (vWA) domain
MAHAVLLDFIRAARGAGVRISTAESLDALKAVDLVGYASRERLHDTLGLALAKTSDDKRLLDETFARFFTSSRLSSLAQSGDSGSSNNPSSALPPPTEGSSGTPTGSGGGSGGMPQPSSALGQMLMQGDASALAVAMAQAAQRANLGNMQVITQKGLFGRRVMQEMGSEALDLEIIAAEDAASSGQRALAEELKRRRQMLREEVKDLIARQYLLQAAQANRELREEIIREANLATLYEFRGVEQIVRKLAKKIAAQHSRRRRVEQRGLLDVRRTLARNIRHDGILFEPQWRSKRIDRPNVVVVCDVSGSVRAYAKFLLLFLYSLADVLPRVRSFAFSYRLGEVTELFRQHDFDDAVAATLETLGMGSTDYGLAFEELERLCYDSVDHRTTLIVLGDARSNYAEPRADILKRFSERVRQVIWLNPEFAGRWGSGDSVMPRYKPYCTVAETTRTIDDLERVVERLLKRA